MMLSLAFSFYSIKTGRQKRNSISQPSEVERGTVNSIEQTKQNEVQRSNEAEQLLPTIKRIRVSLAKYLPGGRETLKYRAIFDGLEISALRNEIDVSALDLFTKSLKPALEDNNIDQAEMEALLELLESAMIN